MKKKKQNTVESAIDSVAKLHSTIIDPAVFLSELMVGFDPRKRESNLHNLVQSIANSDALPDAEQWRMIKEMVLYTDLYSVAPVSLEQSYKASKDLLEFMYAKKRAVNEIKNVDSEPTEVAPLTEEEVDDFEEWFLSRF